ncbi:MAG TPA: proliferating cell nuclear antigen (pcna) [Candidatus Diapherotrites archaeon]|uniref:DNA polymerase sliding clamp n=1 Tax=Candidatus Iainarchaeum sp. TaxID=3101447 RepID=A0A7J4J2Y7_9ARCH|nr:proliferating cell nuclear antigen (pcna) [Candidatus Diapherotrites archaeon]
MIELNDVSFLKSSIDAISSFIPEGNFRFNDRGVHFRGTDPSQVVLVDYFIDRSVFDSFEVEPAYVGINLSELSRIVSRAQPQDHAVINLSESELRINLRGELERSFKLPLLDISDGELKLPEARYDASVEINARLLREALKDASLFSSSVVIKTKGDRFFLESKGSAGVLNVNSSPSKGVKVKSKADVTSKYSLNYLQNIVKEAGPDSVVTLELRSDSPLKASYKIGKSEIVFYLAHMLL